MVAPVAAAPAAAAGSGWMGSMLGGLGAGLGGAIGGGLLGGAGDQTIDFGDMMPQVGMPIWEDAIRAIGQLQNPQYYGGQLVAGMNPYLSGALGNMAGWGGGQGGDMMNQMYGTGSNLLGAYGQGMDYLQNMIDTGGNQFQYDQGTFDTTMGNLMPGLQGQFDDATRDITRGLNWDTLPGLNMSAAGSGQLGGTKLGQGSVLAQAAAQDRTTDMGSRLYSNALNQANQGAMSGGMANLGANFQTLGQFNQMGQAGQNMMNSAYGMGLNNMQQGLQAGQIQQGYDQSLIDADMKKWNFNQQSPWLAAQNRLNMINSNKRQGHALNPGMSGWEGAMQGLNAGMGMYGFGQNQGWWGGGGGPQNTDNWRGVDWSQF